MSKKFRPRSRLTNVAKNILPQRYFHSNEKKWKQVARRMVDAVCLDWDKESYDAMYDFLYNRYGVPNSPFIANAGKKKNAGYSACFVVPFEDSIEEIYKTKYDFALVARAGGGCGTTLSNIRPQGAPVSGSSHDYAGGAIPFADTISHDMSVLTQGGFREMALMFTMRYDHPDIMKFIKAKTEEGRISNANISVFATDGFMLKVQNDEKYWTRFGGKKYEELSAREVFSSIIDGAWANGEPGILFDDRINDSPYKYDGVKIESTNPCGEQPLVPFSSCNLMALDLSKFTSDEGRFDWELFEIAIRLNVRFLDEIIDKNTYPSKEFEDAAKRYRPIGAGIMGWADVCLKKEISYGSTESLGVLDEIMAFYKETSYDESETLGRYKGIPKGCKNLPIPRRNVTVMTIAPTGTTSIIAGCNSGIEPFFSEITQRKDRTGEYTLNLENSEKPYFRCAVPKDGEKWKEVSWEEHVLTQTTAQKHIDSGVSKTINFPQKTHRETIGKAFMMAWENGAKGITVYRNGSRDVEVLTPKNVQKNLCPECGAPTKKFDGCTSCTVCEWSLCTV